MIKTSKKLAVYLFLVPLSFAGFSLKANAQVFSQDTLTTLRICNTIIVKVAIAIYHLLITLLQWLFHLISSFSHWLSTSLNISENGMLYILLLILVIMIFRLSRLAGQVAYLKAENETMKTDKRETEERENRKAIIEAVINVVHWFTQQ
jgi:Na+-transporting methylmalonyl-CoA/oxaloacetate decarboxylase gamma subunit